PVAQDKRNLRAGGERHLAQKTAEVEHERDGDLIPGLKAIHCKDKGFGGWFRCQESLVRAPQPSLRLRCFAPRGVTRAPQVIEEPFPAFSGTADFSAQMRAEAAQDSTGGARASRVAGLEVKLQAAHLPSNLQLPKEVGLPHARGSREEERSRAFGPSRAAVEKTLGFGKLYRAADGRDAGKVGGRASRAAPFDPLQSLKELYRRGVARTGIQGEAL